MKPALLLLVAALCTACSTGPIVQVDRDSAATFDAYGDYAWRQLPAISNPLLKQRIVAAVDADLAAKGWRQVPEQEADVVLVANVSAKDQQTIDAFYDGPDWSAWSWRGGASGFGMPRRVEVRSFRVGTLVLDLFDAKTRRAVWRASAEGTVPGSEAKRQAAAMKAVHAMLADFPVAAHASK